MDFDLNDEQRLLRDSVDRLLADRYGFEDRKRYAREPGGWSRAMWRAFAELGLLGLPFSEDHGGFGGGAVETAIVQEAFGGALVLEPFFTTVVLCVLMAPLLAAAVGGLISDPRVSLATLTEQVPVTIVYTLLVSPIVIWLTTRGRHARFST